MDDCNCNAKLEKVITLCLWRRPAYTRQVIDALRNCAGVHDYTIFVHIDGGDRGVQAAVTQEAGKIDFAKYHIVTEEKNLGCNQNTRRCLEHGFSYSDYVIHCEDDIVFSPDALQYFEWARQFESDPSIFIVSAWPHPNGWLPTRQWSKPPEMDRWASVIPNLWIWGWATWKSRWTEMIANWTQETNDLKDSWDFQLDRIRGNRGSLVPHTSRSINIGSELGVHRGDHVLPYWAQSPEFSGKPSCFLATPKFIRVEECK